MSSHLEAARFLKFAPGSTIGSLAEHLKISFEGARQLVDKMSRDGLVVPSETERSGKRGRPAQEWVLTARGEHLFPKRYDELSDALISAAGRGVLNGQAAILAEIADAKTAELLPQGGPESTEARWEAVSRIYAEEDEFLTVERDGEETSIVEHNCPYLSVALAHPGLCSVTTNVLGRVLGKKVVRSETFQDGDGRCVFEVLPQQAPAQFELEPRFAS